MSNPESFNEWFKELTGRNAPDAISRIDLKPVNGLFWSTLSPEIYNLVKLPCSSTLKGLTVPYRVLGHWGYGMNSYAFYYFWKEPGVRINLRIPYGGISSSDERDKDRLVRRLNHIEGLVGYLRRFCELSIVDNMDDVKVTLTSKSPARTQIELTGWEGEEFWKQVVSQAEGM